MVFVPYQITCVHMRPSSPPKQPLVVLSMTLCRPLPGSCMHSCLLLCHTAPCLPCQLLVDAACRRPGLGLTPTCPVCVVLQAAARVMHALVPAAVPPGSLPSLPAAGGCCMLLRQGAHEAAVRQQRVLLQVRQCSRLCLLCVEWLVFEPSVACSQGTHEAAMRQRVLMQVWVPQPP